MTEAGNERLATALRWLFGAALALPVFLLSYLVGRFGFDVPLVDEWSLPYDIERFLAGEWTLTDILRSHNGHRLALSRLILVPLAALTDFDPRWGMALSIAVMLGGFALWAAPALEVLGGNRRPVPPLAALGLAAISVGVFSLGHWENWLWGTQLQVTLAATLAWATLRVLAVPEPSNRRVGAGAALALLAALAQVPGLCAAWVAGLLLASNALPRRRRVLVSTLWFAATAAGTWAYFQHAPLDSAPPRPALLVDPIGWFRFAATFLGSPLAPWAGVHYPPTDRGFAWMLGTLAIGALAALWWSLRDRRGETGVRTLFAFAAWAIACALLTALGRAEGGSAAALSSRYLLLALPLAGTVLLLTAARASELPPGRWRRALVLAVFACCALFGLKSLESLPRFVEREETLRLPREALRAGGPMFELARLQPHVEQVETWRPALERLGLSVFREGERRPRPAVAPDPIPPAEAGQRIEWIAGDPPALKLPGGMRPRTRIRLQNTSSHPWPAFGRDLTIAGAVLVSARFHDSSGTGFESPRHRLPHDLWPGEVIEMDLCLAVPAPPGTYRIEVSALQQDEFRFSEGGAQPLEATARVVSIPRPLRAVQKLWWRIEYYLGLWPCR